MTLLGVRLHVGVIRCLPAMLTEKIHFQFAWPHYTLIQLKSQVLANIFFNNSSYTQVCKSRKYCGKLYATTVSGTNGPIFRRNFLFGSSAPRFLSLKNNLSRVFAKKNKNFLYFSTYQLRYTLITKAIRSVYDIHYFFLTPLSPTAAYTGYASYEIQISKETPSSPAQLAADYRGAGQNLNGDISAVQIQKQQCRDGGSRQCASVVRRLCQRSNHPFQPNTENSCRRSIE